MGVVLEAMQRLKKENRARNFTTLKTETIVVLFESAVRERDDCNCDEDGLGGESVFIGRGVWGESENGKRVG